MTSFILDGTTLPFPKADLVPLGSAPANKYSIASDWNTVCQASVDMQTFLRGNFLLFKSDDLTTRAALILSNGAPVVNAEKGSLALDITTPAVYQNQDGVATWLPLAGGGGSMAIGAPVTGGTSGSMLYVGASTFLQQDNSNLYYDNVNKRVGIGNNAPGASIDLSSATTTAGMAMRAGSTLGVSAGSTGRLRYNEGTQRFQVSMNGAAYVDLQTGADFTLDIGDAIGSSTVGSILFVGAGNVLQQDNASLFFDNTNNRLGVGTATPGAVSLVSHAIFGTAAGRDVLEIKNGAIDGYSTIWFTDSADVHQSSFGFGNASVAITRLRGKHYMFGANDFVIDDTAAIAMSIKPTANSVSLEMFNGSAGAVASANAGRIRYTTTGQKFQVSANGGAFVDLATGTGMAIGTTITSATQGSVLFAGVGGVLQQDNANLFYDDTNNKLGVGTATFLDNSGIGGATVSYLEMAVPSAAATGFVIAAHFHATAPNTGFVGVGGRGTKAAPAAVQSGDILATFNGVGQYDGTVNHISTAAQIFISATENWSGTNRGGRFTLRTVTNTTTTLLERLAVENDGGVTFQNSAAAAVSGASTGRLRYDTVTQKLQVSNNGAAYVPIAVAAASYTAGSVPFANGTGQLAQDNANLFFDDTNNRLGIGTNTPAWALHVVAPGAGVAVGRLQATSADAYTEFEYYDSAGTFKAGMGYANATVAIAHVQSKIFMYSAGPDIVLANATRNEFTFGMTTTATNLQMQNGSTAAVSDANTGRIRYNTTGQKFQLSTNGGAYFDIASTSPSVERLNADGAASIATDVTFVSGTGTDLTLANGTIDGFIKTFVVTSGDGTITPANLADGNVLTWTAGPANVSFIWDATGVTWHVHGNPYNMVTT